MTSAHQKICRRCSTITETDGELCPQCGARYDGRRFSRRTRRAALVSLLVVLLGAGGATAALVVHHDHVEVARKRALAAHRAAFARHEREVQEEAQRITEREAKAAEQAKHEEIAQRATLEHELEQAITKEARARVGDVPGGIPEATIFKTECLNTSGASSHELSGSTTGQFECIAVSNEPPPGGHETGYRYTATIEFASGRYTWHEGE
jgi:hypothetical protein